MSTPPPEKNYDWIFSYKLSKPVYCRQSKNDSTTKFDKDSTNKLTGFRIKLTNETDSRASEISKMKAEKLEKILTILSGMELKALPAGAKGIPYTPGLLRVHESLIIIYDIEGSGEMIDTTDPNIESLINKDVDPELQCLSEAVAHKSHGRYSEAIKGAFRVIDEKPWANHFSKIVRDYNKYRCMRNIFSHKEGDLLDKGTMDDFIYYFDPIHDKFEFKRCNENNRVFIFDFDSSKTKKILAQVAEDLIAEVKAILGFPL